ncbi:ATP-binding protein [Desulfobotulus sp. H1]|uniref:histidine kinase n=1 Tax=Desulfobotulus pelophilus TaxID=2823377 RepID=A0ABT3N7Z4_9BACT|nr:ATP-binding protein [Desulfobotulus pelophilus]MCW7753575.1 ATP-binding protein [Desulfobotulus pelophilus]
MNPPEDVIVQLIEGLSQAPSLEDFHHLLSSFIRRHTGIEIWLGLHHPPFNGLFRFSDHILPPPFSCLELSTEEMEDYGRDKKPDGYTLIPIHFGKKTIAILACEDSGCPNSASQHSFLQRLAALSGLAIHHLFVRQDLEQRKNELEKKVFELAMLEESGASLAPELDIAAIAKKLLLSVGGYLTATSAALYLKEREHSTIFHLAAETGTSGPAWPRDLSVSYWNSPGGWPRFVRSGDIHDPQLSALAVSMGMEILFPLRDDAELGVLVFFGPMARKLFPEEGALHLAAAMISQSLAPFRNAILYADLKQNNAALEKSLGNLQAEITEKKQTQEKLLAYQGVVAASQDPMALIGSDFCFVLANRACAEAFGTTSQRLEGKNIARVTDPDLFQKKLEKPLIRCLGGETARFRFSWSFPGWGLRHIDVAAYPYKGSVPERHAAIFILRDITQMQELENRLLQSQKMEAIGTLAGGIAHDFNNILAGIMGYAELAIAKLDSPDGARPYIEKALSACNRASELIRQILSFARGESNNKDMRPLCLTEITEDVLKLLRASLPATLEIELYRRESPLPVLGNPTQLHQLIMNLCTNAAHAMPNGGTISVGIRGLVIGPLLASTDPAFQEGTYAELTVKDRGTGIPEAYLCRIFDPFFTTKPQGKGTGMGLSISHGIIGRHGGVIQVETQTGRGSTFRVFLPLLPALDVPGPDRTQLPAPTGGSEHILLVEDEPDLLHLSTTILSGLGYEITGTSCPKEALRIFQKRPQAFDLAILDQIMPHMTGVQLARHLLGARPGLPILLCSGFSEAIAPTMLEFMGIRSYLMKPFTRHQLASAVRSLLD